MTEERKRNVSISQGGSLLIATILIGVEYGVLNAIIAFFVMYCLMPIVED